MPTPNQPGNTGQNQADLARAAAGQVGGVALDLAQGATAFQAATNALKGAALDKLLGPTAIFAGGLIGVLRTMKAIVDQSGLLERGLKRIANIQQIQGKFETLLKSAEKAQKRMEELYKFANRSPFDLADIAEANRILEALSKGALSAADGMEMVGDAAAAAGESMSEVATRVGKLYAALRSGRSLDKILFQLQMSGIVTDELAVSLENAELAGSSFAEKWKLVTDVLKRSEGGMKNELATMKGLEAQIKNASAAMEQAFGQPFVEAQAKAMQNTLEATKNLTPLMGKIAADAAPILKIFTNAKNSITEMTLATKGFADVLGTAWEVAKAMTVALAAGSAANLFRNVAPLVRAGSANRAVAASSTGTPGYTAGMAKSAELAAGASSAFAEAAFGTALALKAQSLWVGLSTRAISLHGVAVAAATAGQTKFSAAKYAGVVAAGLLSGALGILRVAYNAVAGAAAGAGAALVKSPWTMIAMAAATSMYAIYEWANSVEKAKRSYIDFISEVSGRRNELDRLARSMETLDDYRSLSDKNRAEETKTVEAMRALGADPTKYEYTVGRDGSVTNTGRILNGEESADWRAKREELNKSLRAVRDRQKVMDSRVGSLEGGAAEKAAVAANVEGAMKAADARLQESMARASGLGRLNLLDARIRRDSTLADLGQRIDEAKREGGGPSPLKDVSARIAAIRATPNGVVPNALIEEQTRLNALSTTWRDRRQQIDSDMTERQSLADSLRASFADVLGNAMANRQLAAGNASGAAAIGGAQEFLRLVQQYKDLGLTPAQAKQDFNAKIAAESRDGNRIVADSLASIGGGGGTYAGDALGASIRRQTEIAAASQELLKQIEKNTGGTIDTPIK